jgi:hypothetical protein
MVTTNTIRRLSISMVIIYSRTIVWWYAGVRLEMKCKGDRRSPLMACSADFVVSSAFDSPDNSDIEQPDYMETPSIPRSSIVGSQPAKSRGLRNLHSYTLYLCNRLGVKSNLLVKSCLGRRGLCAREHPPSIRSTLVRSIYEYVTLSAD